MWTSLKTLELIVFNSLSGPYFPIRLYFANVNKPVLTSILSVCFPGGLDLPLSERGAIGLSARITYNVT